MLQRGAWREGFIVYKHVRPGTPSFLESRETTHGDCIDHISGARGAILGDQGTLGLRTAGDADSTRDSSQWLA